MVMKIMDGKFKLKGHLKHLTRWPLYLTALLIILNIVVYAIDIKAGVVVTLGALIYLACAVGIFCYHRPQMFNDLVAFASQYEFLEKRVLEELALPYAIMDMQGRMIWCNKVFAQLTGKDQFYRKILIRFFRILRRTSFRFRKKKRYPRSVHRLVTVYTGFPCSVSC